MNRDNCRIDSVENPEGGFSARRLLVAKKRVANMEDKK